MRLSEAIDLLDHAILKAVIPSAPVCWADLGCGTGLFTEALARFLPARSAVYGVDLRPGLHSDSVNGVALIAVSLDFVRMPLPEGMDGFMMANALHYVEDKRAFLLKLRGAYRDQMQRGPLLIVEYDTDRPVEKWVPWPVSFSKLGHLLRESGWTSVEKLGELDSAFGGKMYAALAR